MSSPTVAPRIPVALAAFALSTSLAARAEAQDVDAPSVETERIEVQGTETERIGSEGIETERVETIDAERVDVTATETDQVEVRRTVVEEEVEVPPAHEPVLASSERAPDVVRPRLGISVLGGYTFEEPEGWMLGGSVRLGISVGEWFSVAYQPSAFYAALVQPGSGDDGAFALWNTLLLEITPVQFFSIGVGPSLDIWAGCQSGVAPDVGQSRELDRGKVGCAEDNASFGLHGRVAVNLGDGPGRGGGVQISFEAHPTWFGDDFTTIALLGGLGVEVF